MTDSLRVKLVAVLSAIAPVHLSEAEVDGYPYIVYDMETTPIADKDGVHRFDGDTKIRIVSDDKSAADALMSPVQSAIMAGMRDAVFSSHLTSVGKECVDGIWTIELNYTLRQYADWVNE